MKVLKKAMSLVLTGVLLVGISTNVNAAEKIYESIDYVPNEGTNIDVSDIIGSELQNGEKTIIGEYTVEYQGNIVCLNPNSRATTKEYSYTSHYKISNNGNEQEWYRIIQTTNYTYDGKTVQINTSSCNLNVTKYYDDATYTVNQNLVNNSSNTAPTYTIGLTMKFPSQSLTITDVVTAYADGTTIRTHYE